MSMASASMTMIDMEAVSMVPNAHESVSQALNLQHAFFIITLRTKGEKNLTYVF